MRKRLISVLLASAMALALAAAAPVQMVAQTQAQIKARVRMLPGAAIFWSPIFPGQATQRKWLRISRNRPAATCMRFSR